MRPRPILVFALLLAAAAIGLWFWTTQGESLGENPGANPAHGPERLVQKERTQRSRQTPLPETSERRLVGVDSSVQPGIPLTQSPRPDTAPSSADIRGRADPKGPRTETRSDLENVQLMLRDFRTRMGENPVGSNAEIMAAVMGGNPVKAHLGPPPGQTLNDQGELVDRWGTPYFFHQLSKDQMEIRSAGADQRMWTSDDIQAR